MTTDHDGEFQAANGEQPGLDLEAYHAAMKPKPLSATEQLNERIAKEKALQAIASRL